VVEAASDTTKVRNSPSLEAHWGPVKHQAGSVTFFRRKRSVLARYKPSAFSWFNAKNSLTNNERRGVRGINIIPTENGEEVNRLSKVQSTGEPESTLKQRRIEGFLLEGSAIVRRRPITVEAGSGEEKKVNHEA